MRAQKFVTVLQPTLLSGAGAINGILRVENMIVASGHISMASGTTLVAACTVQASNDPGNVGVDDSTGAGVVNWVTLSTTEATAQNTVSGNTAGVIFNITNMGYKWLRFLVTWTSGSGTVTITAGGKGQS